MDDNSSPAYSPSVAARCARRRSLGLTDTYTRGKEYNAEDNPLTRLQTVFTLSLAADVGSANSDPNPLQLASVRASSNVEPQMWWLHPRLHPFAATASPDYSGARALTPIWLSPLVRHDAPGAISMPLCSPELCT